MPFIWLIITFIIAYFIYKISKVQKTNQCLLESPKNYYFGKENISGIPVENNLYNSLKNYCVKNGAIVSLSGGVDSMVLLA
jgi:hypothetical protein